MLRQCIPLNHMTLLVEVIMFQFEFHGYLERIPVQNYLHIHPVSQQPMCQIWCEN